MTALSLLSRLLTIAGMIAVIVILMHLTGPTERPLLQKHSPATTAQSRAARIAAMADAWTGGVAFGAPYSALTPLSADANAATDSHFDPSDDYWGLPRSAGVDTVASYCSACHSLAIVMQQRQDAAGWNSLLDWMAEKQGMAPPPPDTRAEIIAYLSRELGPN